MYSKSNITTEPGVTSNFDVHVSLVSPYLCSHLSDPEVTKEEEGKVAIPRARVGLGAHRPAVLVVDQLHSLRDSDTSVLVASAIA